jgi:hypothetical protein
MTKNLSSGELPPILIAVNNFCEKKQGDCNLLRDQRQSALPFTHDKASLMQIDTNSGKSTSSTNTSDTSQKGIIDL